MGFYIRKSISVGPLRFNLSKSGVGVSTGIKGFRVGTGPRGNYVHVGAGGLYYRKTLSSPSVQSSPALRPSDPSGAVNSHSEMEEIESGSVAEMTDSSATELLEELNNKHKKWSLWPVVIVLGLLISYASQFNPWVIGGSTLCVLLAFWRDQLRKTTVLFYDFEPDAERRYQALHDGFDRLKSCNKSWHVEAKGNVTDPKYHAGANTLITRKAVAFSKGVPPHVKTNIQVPVLPAGKQMLYFFPERILVYENNKVGAVAYSGLDLSTSPIRFIEEETVPRDAKIVDRTWRYTNKKGGPDKRFRDNREIPIVLYERLMFSSSSGLREYFDVSTTDVSDDFVTAIRQMAA